jgi:hypothetical protein
MAWQERFARIPVIPRESLHFAGDCHAAGPPSRGPCRKEKARRMVPAGPFATPRVTVYRAAVLGRVGMVIFTVSPF